MPYKQLYAEENISIHYLKIKNGQDLDLLDSLCDQFQITGNQLYGGVPFRLKWKFDENQDTLTVVYALFEGLTPQGTPGSIAFVNLLPGGFAELNYITSRIAQRGYAAKLLEHVIRHALGKKNVHRVSLTDATQGGIGTKLYGSAKLLQHFKIHQDDKKYAYEKKEEIN